MKRMIVRACALAAILSIALAHEHFFAERAFSHAIARDGDDARLVFAQRRGGRSPRQTHDLPSDINGPRAPYLPDAIRTRPDLVRVAAIAGATALLGPVVTNPRRASFYLTRHEGRLVLQSNYREPGTGSGPPEAIVLSEDPSGVSVSSAMERTLNPLGSVFRSGRPGRPHAPRNAPLYVDTEVIRADGRPAVDLTGLANIRVVRDGRRVETGRVELLPYGEPPPALIENLAGCCLMGRPPGRAAEIRRMLRSRTLTSRNTHVASMVLDSATADIFRRSSTLRRIGTYRTEATGSWRDFLNAALRRSADGNLILLTHVENSRVVVQDAAGRAVFDLPIAEVQEMASATRVNLILIGCETSTSAAGATLPIAVAGRYNTVDAAQRIVAAIEGGANRGDRFMAALAGPEMVIVAQPGNWGPRAVGGAAYLRARETIGSYVSYSYQRVMRFWFFGGRRG